MQKILWLLDNVNRIGHIFMEPYYMLNLFNNCERNSIILIPATKNITNVAALKIIQRYFRIEVCEDMNLFNALFNNVRSNDVQFRDFIVMKWRSRLWLDYLKRCADSNGFKPKRFNLTYDEIRNGLAIQGQIGIPSNGRIVVLHNREPGYLPQLTYHSGRDAHIENFIPAIEYLTDRGYWVVRIGDPTMVPLPEMPQVIDLPFYPKRTDFMDIWFSATCTCFIGNTSGPMLIPFVFGRPRLLVNFVGQPCLYGHPFDLYIPKLHYWRLKNRYLTLAESVRSDTGRADGYENQGIEIQENSSDDIVDAVREMVHRVEGSFHVSEQMRMLQTGYRRAMEVVEQERARIGEFNLHYYEPIEMGYQFLKKHLFLLATEQNSGADIQIHKRHVSCAPVDAFVTNGP
jgi:putative glycosyltransferase (TIGR04372 family)